MGEAPHLRISDEDREQAADAIRAHFAAGRLDSDELEERVQAAYAARTQGELTALTADLPALPATPAQARAMVAARRGELRRRALQEAGGSFTPFLICTLIWALSGASGFFWPAFLLVGPVAMFGRVGWALYGPAPSLEEAEAHLRRHRHHGQRRRHRR